MKKVATMLLFVGVLLMLASVVIAYVSGCSANIIGGADGLRLCSILDRYPGLP